ncbi:UDP-glucose dehydrogenase family protein [Paenibacillus koleovorans]|uniref:UDP-glucose dehydrogenase family protein n=1 Tax=Paenibacillus koleovorans TaxID=121608 RepID=UPI001C3FD72C|nr:UDP-glucose/GDP-mannose dehydrogenase family protein [Paenibacillus koleovorans]
MPGSLGKMKVSVIGLGYVGCVTAACLAKMGHSVIGVDVNPGKVEQINRGKPTIVEEGIALLVEEQHLAGRLSATESIRTAVEHADCIIICVGTPSDKYGNVSLTSIWNVAEEVGEALRGREKFLTLIIRSTVPPGTCREMEQILARSGLMPDRDFAVVSNPEFLREGTSIKDYFNPPYTLIGTRNETAISVVRAVYADISAPVLTVEREAAEIMKYVNNSFHALKVVFANEIGAVCHEFGIDPHRVMDIFCQDQRLNISSAYLKPGFAYGGSCLPKDLRALNGLARSRHIEVPVLSSIEQSNAEHLDRAFRMIEETGVRRIGVLGLAFKEGTDDLRESPVVCLLERLVGRGYEVKIYDRFVLSSNLMGANKSYMEATVPHLLKWIVHNRLELKEFAELIVVAQNSEEHRQFAMECLDSTKVIDLVRIIDPAPDSSRYQGLIW